jgi:hypothetical protein
MALFELTIAVEIEAGSEKEAKDFIVGHLEGLDIDIIEVTEQAEEPDEDEEEDEEDEEDEADVA